MRVGGPRPGEAAHRRGGQRLRAASWPCRRPRVDPAVGRRRRATGPAVVEVVAESWAPSGWSSGLPLSLDGREGPAARAGPGPRPTRCAELLDVPVELLRRAAHHGDAPSRSLAGGRRQGAREAGAGVVDQVAAAVLLQSWLDAPDERRPRTRTTATRPRRRDSCQSTAGWPLVARSWLLVAFLVVAGSGVLWVQRQRQPARRARASEVAHHGRAGHVHQRHRPPARARRASSPAPASSATTSGSTALAPIEAGDYTLHKKEDIGRRGRRSSRAAAKVDEDAAHHPRGPHPGGGGRAGRRAARPVGREVPARWPPAAPSAPSTSRRASPASRGCILPETYFVVAERRRGRHPPAHGRVLRRSSPPSSTSPAPRPASGVTPYQAVIVASLVEREARVDEDRGKVARVIYNRLEAEMPLQIDATVRTPWASSKERSCSSATSRSTRPTTPTRIAGPAARAHRRPGPGVAGGRPVARRPGPGSTTCSSTTSGRHAFAETTGRAQPQHRPGRAERRALSA